MRGAIAAGHPLTAEAGARVLRDGGNAVDALLAAAFTAFVTEGPLTGPAGGGFALVHEPSGATTMLDCFFGVPAASLGEMEELLIDFGDSGTQVFHVGEGSVAVPGLLAGLELVHERFATREWGALVDPAIALARDGFERDEQRLFLHTILAGILQRDEGGRRIYGDPARVRTADACDTLERVRDAGAEMLVELLPELADDLRGYRVLETEPLELAILGCELRSVPTQGGAVVRRILELLDTHDGQPPLEGGGACRRGRLRAARVGTPPGHHPHLRDRRERARRRPLVHARLRVGRLPRRDAAEQHARRARRHRPRAEGARRPPREHDDPDARARVRDGRGSSSEARAPSASRARSRS